MAVIMCLLSFKVQWFGSQKDCGVVSYFSMWNFELKMNFENKVRPYKQSSQTSVFLTGKFHHLIHISPTLPNMSVLLEDGHHYSHLHTLEHENTCRDSENISVFAGKHLYSHLCTPLVIAIYWYPMTSVYTGLKNSEELRILEF